jgi:hypothetical protein
VECSGNHSTVVDMVVVVYLDGGGGGVDMPLGH